MASQDVTKNIIEAENTIKQTVAGTVSACEVSGNLVAVTTSLQTTIDSFEVAA